MYNSPIVSLPLYESLTNTFPFGSIIPPEYDLNATLDASIRIFKFMVLTHFPEAMDILHRNLSQIAVIFYLFQQYLPVSFISNKSHLAVY